MKSLDVRCRYHAKAKPLPIFLRPIADLSSAKIFQIIASWLYVCLLDQFKRPISSGLFEEKLVWKCEDLPYYNHFYYTRFPVQHSQGLRIVCDIYLSRATYFEHMMYETASIKMKWLFLRPIMNNILDQQFLSDRQFAQ